MIFAKPLPFDEALDAAEVRSVLPTTGNTADLRALDSAIKRRAMFSATETSARALDAIGEGVRELLDGDNDQASVRLRIKQLRESMSYSPEPGKAGGLQDLSSTLRINLQLETNVATAQGYGNYLQGQQADVLAGNPAQELFRAFGPRDSSDQRPWAERWAQAGGTFFGGRMIALKNDGVWSRLGDPALFDDGLGNPYPPYAFNSGMDVRDISRADAVQLGLMEPGDEVTADSLDFNTDLQASAATRNEWLRSAIEESGLGAFDSSGVLNFTPEGGES